MVVYIVFVRAHVWLPWTGQGINKRKVAGARCLVPGTSLSDLKPKIKIKNHNMGPLGP